MSLALCNTLQYAVKQLTVTQKIRKEKKLKVQAAFSTLCRATFFIITADLLGTTGENQEESA